MQNVKDLLRYGENLTLEYKKAERGLPRSIWETYSAFANTRGGTILLGVEEQPGAPIEERTYHICGVQNPDKLIGDFWNTINSNKVSVNILVDADVTTQVVDGKTLVCIDVPQATYLQRPVYLNENVLKNTFKRGYEGDYHCTEEEIKAMLRDASDAGNDGTLLVGYTMDDIDLDTLTAYRMEFDIRNPGHVWSPLSHRDFLMNLGGYTVERPSGREGLTTAGLLMFGKGLPIRERFDHIRMDYIDETNRLPGSRWSDRLTYDGTWENNLYNFLKRVIPKLIEDIKRPFRMEGIVRIDDTAVHRAVREAFVNLIIHSDYLISGVLKIIKRDRGFYFSNPGNLKLPIDMIYGGGHSATRNPRMQTMLRMIGLGDNIGSGFPTILSAWGEENWRKPDLSDNLDVHIVELKLWTISAMPQECTDYLYQLFGAAYGRLSAHEQIILATAYLEDEVSNTQLQSLLDLHPTDIGKVLYGLTKRSLLLMNHKGPWTTYRLNREYQRTETMPEPEITVSEALGLNPTDRLIYEYLCENELITKKQIKEITRIKSDEGARTAVLRLMKKDLIEKMRRGRFVYYRRKK